MKTRIAVISDLHVGPGARAADLYVSPKGSSHHPQEPVLDPDYLKRLEKLTKTTLNTEGSIDLLCITGDITDTGQPEEFRRASEVVLKISEILGVQEQQVVFVPGNHDVYWPVQTLGTDPFFQQQRYGPASLPELIFQKRNNQLLHGNLFQPPYWGAWETKNANIIAFNTAEHDGPQPTQGEHFGKISADTLEAAKLYLEGRVPAKEKFQICLIHHHPKIYQDPRSEYADFSALVNAEGLLSILDSFKFDLLIHGHKHMPRVWTTGGGNSHPVVVLGSGSFSARLKPEWHEHMANHFHLIEIDRPSPANFSTGSTAQGVVKSWRYSLDKGWHEARHETGIHHHYPFGSNATYGNLVHQLEELVMSQLLNSQYVDINTLLKSNSLVRFADPLQLHRAITEVCAGRYTFKGDVCSPIKDWAVLDVRPI